MQITDPNAPKPAAISDLAFRPFFLLASIAGSLAIGLWLLQLNGLWAHSSPAISTSLWHAEAMIFGFAATVAIGFLLTAAQTWTGLASLSGKPLLALVIIWLAARGCLLSNSAMLIELAIALQALWWLAAIFALARILLGSKNKRNYLFLPLLGVLGTLNIALLLLDLNGHHEQALHISHTAVLVFTLLMTIMAGRVMPFFTKAGLKRIGVNITLAEPITWLERALMLILILATLIFFKNNYTPWPHSEAPLLILAGILQLIRLARWQGLKTLSVPLLWSLHAAYLMMAIGLIALGSSAYIDALSFSDALHIITVGAIGLMILAMISRVSLGHTGRELDPAKIINVAFILLLMAALTRGLGPLFFDALPAWNISGLLWISSFLIFAWVYTPILSTRFKSGPPKP